jgi:hypothetical protein
MEFYDLTAVSGFKLPLITQKISTLGVLELVHFVDKIRYKANIQFQV